MDKRFGGVLAVVGLTASLLAGIGAVDAAPADDGVHARDVFASRGSYAPATAGTSAVPTARARGLTAGMELRGDNGAVRKAVADAGGVVTGEIDGVVHARVPEEQTAALEANPDVESVGPLPRLRPAEESEGVALTGAGTWLGVGTDGTGVDVAIVDIGFAGWSAQLGTELPASVATSFGGCAASDETEHGTAVAEIVHDMAPGATLHLVCVDDTYDLYPNSTALNYLAANDVEVAVASIGTFTESRGDGSSSVDMAINQSRRNGTLWVVAAGNAGDAHVRIPKGAPTQPRDVIDQPGYFIDAVDANAAATFDPFIRFRVPAGGVVEVDARWDAFPYTRIDFDLLAFTSAAVSNAGFVNGSFNDQLNQNLVPPIETFAFQNDAAVARDFYLAVDAYSPVSVPIDIFFVGAYNVEYLTAAGTVSDPGTGPGVLTVGATCAANGVIEPFSSRGPTTDGRVKPDLVGPDGTTSSIYGPASGCLGGFLGTSAATPHVGGAAALVLDADPDLGPTDVQGILERRATPAGVAGKDSTWGWGQLALGAADVPQAPQGDLFTGLSPSRRLLDTRTSATPLVGGSTRQIPIAGTNGVPADATAVVLSVVAVKPTAAGYLTAFPAGAARPVASSLNFAPGQIISNSVTVGLGPNGAIGLFNYAGSTNVVVDIAGWYGPTATTGLATVDPIRAVDTRAGKSTRVAVPGGDIGGNEVLTVELAGNPRHPGGAGVGGGRRPERRCHRPDDHWAPHGLARRADQAAGLQPELRQGGDGRQPGGRQDRHGRTGQRGHQRRQGPPDPRHRRLLRRVGPGPVRRPAHREPRGRHADRHGRPAASGQPEPDDVRGAHGALRRARGRHGRGAERDRHQARVGRSPPGVGQWSAPDRLHPELQCRRDHRERRARWASVPVPSWVRAGSGSTRPRRAPPTSWRTSPATSSAPSDGQGAA